LRSIHDSSYFTEKESIHDSPPFFLESIPKGIDSCPLLLSVYTIMAEMSKPKPEENCNQIKTKKPEFLEILDFG